MSEEDFKKIAEKVKTNARKRLQIHKTSYYERMQRTEYGYDDYMVDVLSFEFISVDCIYFEEKENKVRQLKLLHEGV